MDFGFWTRPPRDYLLRRSRRANSDDFSENLKSKIQNPKSPPPLWPSLLLCAAAALWIDFSKIHQSHHADSLLPALVSLYRWTPFYWELDRIGMLVPLVACPIKHPLANLLMQDFFYLFGGLTALFLLPRYMLRNATYPAVGALSVAALIGLTPPYYRFEYLIDTQYGLWLSLGIGGLILLEPDRRGVIPMGRRVTAVLLMILAHWCYCTAALFLGPLVVFRWLAFRSRQRPAAQEQRGLRLLASSELAASLATLAIGVGIGLALMRLAPIQSTDFGTLPMSQWWQTWRELIAASWQALAPQWWPGCLAICGGAGALATIYLRRARGVGPAWRGAAALAAAACTLGAFMATRQWVAMNGHNFRFLLVPALFLQTALVSLVVAPFMAHCARVGGRLETASLAAIVLLSAAYAFGFPSLRRVHCYVAGAPGDIDDDKSPVEIRTAEVLASRSTHVAGGYWNVWPMVFRTKLALFERGEARRVWGISERSLPTMHQWKGIARSQMRLAVAAGDEDAAQAFFAHYGLLPLTITERYTSLSVYQPAEIKVVPALVAGRPTLNQPGTRPGATAGRSRPN
ncbi:MAG TPA: hypothetical protein VJ783_04485 [Pirellulales bacterium]|nr:hypothetical protein [Pirellulales bacterium]